MFGENLVKNLKFWSKIENFGQKLKVLARSRKFRSKIEKLAKNPKIGEKSKNWSNPKFGQKSKNWSKIDIFGQKSIFLVKNRYFFLIFLISMI